MIRGTMGSRPDYYRLLHVSDDAPLEIIRSSYRTLMKTLGAHPDLGGDDGSAQALNEAWEVLSDRVARARYDAERASDDVRGSTEREAPPEPPPPVRDPTGGNDDAAPASDPEASDRRAITRLRRDEPITWAIGEGRSHAAIIRDLSPRGLSFVSREEIRPGTWIQIQSNALWARAIVRNLRRLGEDEHLVGVEFDSVHFRDSRGTFVSRSA